MICKRWTASYLCCSTLHTSWVSAGILQCKSLKLQGGYVLATLQPDSCLCTQTTVAGNGYVIQHNASAYGVGGHHISIYHRPHSGLWYAEVGKTQNLGCVAFAVSLFRFHSRHCQICCTDWTVMLINSWGTLTTDKEPIQKVSSVNSTVTLYKCVEIHVVLNVAIAANYKKVHAGHWVVLCK